MARQIINLGTPPSGIDGDTERTAWDKANENFSDIYNNSGNIVNVSISSGLNQSISDFVSDAATVKTYGAFGDGTSHPLSSVYSTIELARAVYPHAMSLSDEIDWAAIQMSVIERSSTYIPAGSYRINRPILIDSSDKSITGAGDDVSSLVATASIDAVISTSSSSSRCSVSNLRIDAGTFETKCISIDGIYNNFNSLELYSSNASGGSPIALCFSSYNRFNNCRFRMLSPACWGLWIDNRSDSGLVISNFLNSCIFSNSGKGVWIKKTHASSPRTEGSLFNGTFFINTGENQLLVDSHYGLQMVASSFEECSGTAVDLNGIDRTQIIGCTAGVSATAVGAFCVRLRSGMGKGTVISGNQFRGGDIGILIEASSTESVSGVDISSNVFDAHSLCSLSLDSVDGCSVSGNSEVGGALSRGSFNTHRTNAAGGKYSFRGNNWTSGAAFFDPQSKYISSEEFGGAKMANSGSELYSTPTTTATINHGLIATPSRVLITPEGNIGSFFVTNVSSSDFSIIWSNSVACKWHWEAKI